MVGWSSYGTLGSTLIYWWVDSGRVSQFHILTLDLSTDNKIWWSPSNTTSFSLNHVRMKWEQATFRTLVDPSINDFNETDAHGGNKISLEHPDLRQLIYRTILHVSRSNTIFFYLVMSGLKGLHTTVQTIWVNLLVMRRGLISQLVTPLKTFNVYTQLLTITNETPFFMTHDLDSLNL